MLLVPQKICPFTFYSSIFCRLHGIYSVLGPVLFLIRMSDIDKDISESKVVSFADDTHIYHKINSDDSTNRLQTDLYKMYNWSVTNNMLFNASKIFIQ